MKMPWSSAGRLVPIAPPYVKPGWPPNRWSLRALGLATALFAVTLFAGVAPAAADTPCWKKVVQDWYADGRIDGTYPASCLNEANRRIPEDLKVYSSFEDQTKQARQKAGRTLAVAGAASRARERSRGPQVADEPSRGPFQAALDKTSPRNADSVPLPLLILAGMALLLISAGAAGLVTRRVRARRTPAS
jgi:hypothetical protein